MTGFLVIAVFKKDGILTVNHFYIHMNEWSETSPVSKEHEESFEAVSTSDQPPISKIISNAANLFSAFQINPTNEVRNELAKAYSNVPQEERRKLGYSLKDLRILTNPLNSKMKTLKRKKENLQTNRKVIRFTSSVSKRA